MGVEKHPASHNIHSSLPQPMASILVFHEPTFSRRSVVVRELKRVDDLKSTLRLDIVDVEPVHEGNCYIYYGNLIVEDRPSRKVVCKVGYLRSASLRLQKEAGFYAKELKEFQGDTIPVCYGLFSGEMEEGTASCLVTEYCGEMMKCPLFGMDWEFKQKVIQALVDIHWAGVKHNDFSERNIVVNSDNQPFIIDFDHAEPHECGLTMSIEFHTQEPDPDELGCLELYKVTNNSGAWFPRYIRYMHADVPVAWALDGPERLANVVSPASPGYNRDFVLKRRSELSKNSTGISIGDLLVNGEISRVQKQSFSISIGMTFL
ncbi:hypothetical protein A0H81_07220 [Grifola frondosa]|uniref:Uncharacterized protein n=1 Tax=Grifola frondosa TaxID=5627 RepID=A0A1C7M7T3_GRIFR|nr:hypothetical protein A0H81_07220 [Grifola frondosa]